MDSQFLWHKVCEYSIGLRWKCNWFMISRVCGTKFDLKWNSKSEFHTKQIKELKIELENLITKPVISTNNARIFIIYMRLHLFIHVMFIYIIQMLLCTIYLCANMTFAHYSSKDVRTRENFFLKHHLNDIKRKKVASSWF